MTILDYILDGFEDALQLERELGVRLFECDRALLKPLDVPIMQQESVRESNAGTLRAADAIERRLEVQKVDPPVSHCAKFIFLHDRPLSSKGAEMMDKIIEALKKSYPGVVGDDVIVCSGAEIPQSRAYVVLGAGALRKYFPAYNASPGMWVKTSSGADVLVTYSPEYILRFSVVTPAVQQIKKDMWTSLKALAQRSAQYN